MGFTNGKFLRAIVEYSLAESSQMINVFDYRVTAPVGTEIADADLASAIKTQLESAWSYLTPYISGAVSAFALRLEEIDWDDILLAWKLVRRFYEGTMTTDPTTAGDQLPVFVSGLTTWRNSIYPRHIAKKYIGGFLEGTNDPGGTANAATVSALATFNTVMQGTAVPAGYPGGTYAKMIILNRRYGTYNNINTGITTARWSVQRRRKKNVGS